MNVDVTERRLASSQIAQIVQGDLTAEATDAIVNAANDRLMHGAGVAGAIVRAGGHVIQEESNAWVREHGPVPHAHPAWTSGGRLRARYVIHAVGPVWGEGGEDAKLAAAVSGSLEVADELKLESISFPAISTGIFGFPKERAARVLLAAVRAYFLEKQSGIRTVRFVLFDEPTVEAFKAAWNEVDW